MTIKNKLTSFITTWVLLFALSWTQASAFTDIDNSWYKDSILELKEAWLVNGYGDGRFWPDDNVTRAEILAIIFNATEVELSEVSDEKCFPDVETDTWYAPYVCYAAERKITSWYEDGNFRPNGSVSVIEALAFVWGVFDLDVPKNDDSLAWYEDYITFADSNKIIQKNAYTINNLWKRGQVSEIITRAKELSDGEILNYKSQWCSVGNSLGDKNTIIINATTRSYLLELPNNYDNDTSYPLVLWLHGRTNSGEMAKNYMWLMGWWWKGIEVQDVITAYPAGLGTGPYTWHQEENIDFFDAMILEISENLCIDKSQVHIVGHSLWAYFSSKLSCQRWDVINTMTAVAWSGVDLDCRGPVASLILHNQADALAPYAGSVNAVRIRKEKNMCNEESETMNIWGLNCEVYSECSAGNPVAFCTEYPTYWDVPHSWPIDAAAWVYEFIDMVK